MPQKKRNSQPKKSGADAPSSLAKKVVRSRAPRKKNYVLDLRIHSPASLGYLGIDGIDTAPAMVRLAKVKGLDVIAVTDFYSGDFIDRVIEAATDSKLTVLPGVSLRCKLEDCDDLTLICLFRESYRAADVEQFLVEIGLPKNERGNEDYTLTTEFAEILKIAEQHNAIAIPSRIDKTPQRMNVIATLVEEFGFRTFDLAYSDSKRFFKEKWPKESFNLYSFSSASALAQVGSRNAKVKLPSATFESIQEVASRAEKRD